MLKALLIGGTHGGGTVEVDEHVRDIRLVARLNGFQSKIGESEYEVYYRGEILDASGRKHTVFVRDGEDAILTLIESYRRA